MQFRLKVKDDEVVLDWMRRVQIRKMVVLQEEEEVVDSWDTFLYLTNLEPVWRSTVSILFDFLERASPSTADNIE